MFRRTDTHINSGTIATTIVEPTTRSAIVTFHFSNCRFDAPIRKNHNAHNAAASVCRIASVNAAITSDRCRRRPIARPKNQYARASDRPRHRHHHPHQVFPVIHNHDVRNPSSFQIPGSSRRDHLSDKCHKNIPAHDPRKHQQPQRRHQQHPAHFPPRRRNDSRPRPLIL